MANFEDYWRDSQSDIKAHFDKIFVGDDDFLQKIRYSIGGKLFRSTLVLLVNDALGGKNREEAFDYAAAIELVHAASLVHDSLIDDDVIRRGKEAPHVKFGAKKAVLVGDGMLAKAWTLLRTPESARAVGKGVFALFRGAAMEAKHPMEVLSYVKYLDIIILKTCSLFATSTQLGSLSARADLKTENTMRQYGKCTGIMFQIADDKSDGHLPRTIKDPMKEIEKWKKKAISHLGNVQESEFKDMLIEVPSFMVNRMLQEG